jgi:hypothetical protein
VSGLDRVPTAGPGEYAEKFRETSCPGQCMVDGLSEAAHQLDRFLLAVARGAPKKAYLPIWRAPLTECPLEPDLAHVRRIAGDAWH